MFGGTDRETIELYENTCYSGCPSQENNQKGASDLIPKIRECLFRHDYKAAEELAEGIKGIKSNYGTNLPFGRIEIDFESAGKGRGYSRGLILNDGVAFVKDGGFSREIFISNPRNVMAINLKCALQESASAMYHSIKLSRNYLIIRGKVKN